MHDDKFSTIDDTQLGSVTGGGLFGVVRKGWNKTRGFREGVGDKVNEFRDMPLKDQVATVATGGSLPIAAWSAWNSRKN